MQRSAVKRLLWKASFQHVGHVPTLQVCSLALCSLKPSHYKHSGKSWMAALLTFLTFGSPASVVDLQPPPFMWIKLVAWLVIPGRTFFCVQHWKTRRPLGMRLQCLVCNNVHLQQILWQESVQHYMCVSHWRHTGFPHLTSSLIASAYTGDLQATYMHICVRE